MTIENRDDYIKYRFHRAEESFDEALILAEKEMEHGNKQTVLFMFLCCDCTFAKE